MLHTGTPAAQTHEQRDLASILSRGRHDYEGMDTAELLALRDDYRAILDDRSTPIGVRWKIAEDHDHILDVLEARQECGDPLLN